jgi:hypothetical protein
MSADQMRPRSTTTVELPLMFLTRPLMTPNLANRPGELYSGALRFVWNSGTRHFAVAANVGHLGAGVEIDLSGDKKLFSTEEARAIAGALIAAANATDAWVASVGPERCTAQQVAA